MVIMPEAGYAGKKNCKKNLAVAIEEQQPISYGSVPNPPVFHDDSSTPCVIRLCHGILANADVRANLYLIGVLVLSILGDHAMSLQDYLYTAREHNVFNDYFVKFGWGWTLIVMTPVVMVGGFTYEGCRGLAQGLLRIMIATGVWFGFTTLFDIIRTQWDTSFDTSGHAFILVWSIMFMVEEARLYHNWDLIRCGTTPSDDKTLVQRMRWTTWLMRTFLILAATLCVLWDVMFFSTILFYHTWAEKLLAVGLAVMAWLVLYHGIYTLNY